MLTETINKQYMYIKLQKFYSDTANFKHQYMIFAHVSAQAFFFFWRYALIYSLGVQKDYTFFKMKFT